MSVWLEEGEFDGQDCFRDFQKVRASTLDTNCAWRADFKGNADGRKNLKRDPLIRPFHTFFLLWRGAWVQDEVTCLK